jgi:HEAT repeat protein
MRKVFIATMLTVFFCLSSTVFSSDIDKLIKDLGNKDKAKDASVELGKIGKPAVPALIKALEDNGKYTRRYAARALREMGEDASDAIPALSNAIKDSDSQTREYSVEALGNMVNEAEQVIPVLKKATKDSDNDVKKKAAKSINSLKTYIEEVKKQKELAEEKAKNQKELAEQEELKIQEARKQIELAEQERQQKQDEIRKQKELAEKGNAAAQYSLGLSYYDGNGVSENENEAVKWLTRAAEQGHKDAQAILLDIKNTQETLKVKGFYIGMKLEKAVKLLNEKYKDIILDSDGLFEVSYFSHIGQKEPPPEEPLKTEGGSYYFDHIVSYKNTVAYRGNVSDPLIKADESGKVILIKFPSSVVDKLFNVADMDGKSFAQTFIDNYSIPKLEPEIKETIYGIYSVWAYTSDKGFKVTIDDHKNLLIEKVASAKERKFD